MSLRNAYKLLCMCFLGGSLLTGCGDSTPITQPVTIVAFGDSLTAGYRLPAESAVPAKLQELFMADGHSGVRIINMGISGDTTQDGLARLNLALNANPDIVILELGANDILRKQSPETARENLTTIIDEFQARNVTVILAGVEIPAYFKLGGGGTPDFEPMFEQLAADYDLEYYPNFLAGVQGKKELNLADGLHPNADGTAEIARRIYPVVLDVAQDVTARD